MTRPIDLCLDYAETVDWERAFVIQGAEGMSNEYYIQYMLHEGKWYWTAGGTCGGGIAREDILKRESGKERGWRVSPSLYKTVYS